MVEYLVMGGHSGVGRGVMGVSFGDLICVVLWVDDMMGLVGFAVGGGRCRAVVGRLGYGGWFGFLFLMVMVGKIVVWGFFCVFFSSFWRKYSEWRFGCY